MTDYDVTLPLYELFTRLRQADMPLGIDDYQLLLHALQAGFGLPDVDALARLCRTLWVKSNDEARLFDYHFKQVMAQATIHETTETSASSHRQSERMSTSPEPTSETMSSDAAPSSDMTLNFNIDEQAAQAVLHAASEDEIPYNRFIRSDEYFPMTRRQMKQSWRYLRRPIREGPPVELDVDATINDIGRTGHLLEPVLVPRRKNRTELLLLLDQGGSMVPFHTLSHRLAETALRGGRLGHAGIYYFHNCPVEFLYFDSAFVEARPIQDLLQSLHDERTGVLIFSDAGAARGGLNPERIKMTREFLHQLKQHIRYIAWLNPTPRSRWSSTTAGRIMQVVPMFDISRQGLDNAINVLRGHPIPYTHLEASI